MIDILRASYEHSLGKIQPDDPAFSLLCKRPPKPIFFSIPDASNALLIKNASLQDHTPLDREAKTALVAYRSLKFSF